MVSKTISGLEDELLMPLAETIKEFAFRAIHIFQSKFGYLMTIFFCYNEVCDCV